MKKLITSVTFAVASLVTVLPVAAQQAAPWYVRGAVGQSTYDLEGAGGNKGTNFNAGVGYAFSKYISLEFGYANFGSFSSSGLNGEAQSVYLGPVLTAPLTGGLSVYGRIAAASTNRKVSFGGASNKERDSEILTGIGLGYEFAPNMTGTLEFQKAKDSDVKAINIGVRIGF